MDNATGAPRFEPGEYARELKRRRLTAGFPTIPPAARRAGVGFSTWYAVERGSVTNHGVESPYRAGLDFVLKTARMLNWNLGEAFTLAGIDFDPDNLPPSKEHDIPEQGNVVDLANLPPRHRTLFTELFDLLKAS